MIREIELPRNIEQEPLANPGKVTGFVSPAEDYSQRRLDIWQKIVTDPINTHYFLVESNEMELYGIVSGVTLVVDRSKPVLNGSIIVCTVENEWFVRKLIKKNNKVYLSNGNDEKAKEVTNLNLIVFGAVTWSFRPQTKH